MSDIAIEKLDKQIKVTYLGNDPVRVLFKASFLDDSDVKIVDFNGQESKTVKCDSDVWFNGNIVTVTCPLNKNALAKDVLAYVQPMTSPRCYHLGPCDYFDTCGLRVSVLPKQEWMIVPSDRPGASKGKSEAYSIDLRSRRLVKAAIKYFDQTKFKKSSEKRIAAARIARKAKYFRIRLNPSSSIYKIAKGK